MLGEGLGETHQQIIQHFLAFQELVEQRWAWHFHRLYMLLQLVGATDAWTTRMAPESLLGSGSVCTWLPVPEKQVQSGLNKNIFPHIARNVLHNARVSDS